MKTRVQHAMVLALTLPLMLVGTTSLRAALSPDDKATIAEVKQETTDLLQTIKSYSAAQRDEAVQEIEIAILRVDGRIASLEARIDNQWDEMTQPAREQARARMRTLQQQRIKLAQWYGSLKNSSANAWEDIKSGFSKAYDNVNKAWEKALDEFSDNNG
jgi:TolA-binding protein